jgi:hypothetical protein
MDCEVSGSLEVLVSVQRYSTDARKFRQQNCVAVIDRREKELVTKYRQIHLDKRGNTAFVLAYRVILNTFLFLDASLK